MTAGRAGRQGGQPQPNRLGARPTPSDRSARSEQVLHRRFLGPSILLEHLLGGLAAEHAVRQREEPVLLVVHVLGNPFDQVGEEPGPRPIAEVRLLERTELPLELLRLAKSCSSAKRTSSACSRNTGYTSRTSPFSCERSSARIFGKRCAPAPRRGELAFTRNIKAVTSPCSRLSCANTPVSSPSTLAFVALIAPIALDAKCSTRCCGGTPRFLWPERGGRPLQRDPPRRPRPYRFRNTSGTSVAL